MKDEHSEKTQASIIALQFATSLLLSRQYKSIEELQKEYRKVKAIHSKLIAEAPRAFLDKFSAEFPTLVYQELDSLFQAALNFHSESEA